ncbi:beta-galactosidase-1-like protein 2 isoform X2 [Dreissena polymorpha]|nr:beta-galactosidase-1-like protein 2 isoform X2 [Dreissena polymorpha]
MKGDTQRRRSNVTEKVDNQAEENKYKSKMGLGRYMFRRYSLLKIVFIVGVVYFAVKVWQVLGVPNISNELPPPERKAEVIKWKYSKNSQGLTEMSFQEIINTIKSKQVQKFSRPLTDDEVNTIAKVKGAKLKDLNKVYESSGSLKFKNGRFLLEGKPLRILSGAMHYFRVMPEYWEDRMQKMKDCGLNALETYVAWNLHEDEPGQFNFGGILNIRKYIQTAKKVGLHVILRPGPYICSEWDFGGMPAWLLQDPTMKVRSDHPDYMKAVEKYLGMLIPEIVDLQYSKGGPIIAVQIENEFGSYSSDVGHLKFIKQELVKNGIVEMFFISDGIVNDKSGFQVAPFYDEALPTANFMKYGLGEALFEQIKSISPHFPLVVMEFWSGWFDHWGQPHANPSTKYFASDLESLLQMGASVNFYMFHGGTNFGFMAGANWFNTSTYKSDVTSYDYIAPLNEAGDITPKYEIIRELIRRYEVIPKGLPDLPDLPAISVKGNYGKVVIDQFMQMEDMINSVKPIKMDKPVPMEMLDLGEGTGQNYGFILYRTVIKQGTKLKFTRPVKDRVHVMLNGVEVGLFTWSSSFWEVKVTQDKVTDDNILDILVENHGRVNYVHQGFNRFNEEHKGITGEVLWDGQPIRNWQAYPLQFTEDDMERFNESSKWKIFANWKGITSLYRGTLNINGTPKDTFLNMKGWKKGVAFINGFNLGRYWDEGPQKTLYVPAPVLKPGDNKVVIFELHKASHSIMFEDTPILGGSQSGTYSGQDV